MSCVLCAVAEPAMDAHPIQSDWIVAYVDGNLIAIVEPGEPGVLLAPRRHIPALAAEPAQSAPFLAALRRTVVEVQTAYGTSGAMIEPTADLPGAAGHVCYRVLPTRPEGQPMPAEPDPATEARVLATALSEPPPEGLRAVVGPGGPSPT